MTYQNKFKDLELGFHGALWLNAYADYQHHLFELEDYGDPNDYLSSFYQIKCSARKL